MLTEMYRSEYDLVIWLLFGFEKIIVQVTDRECPLAHMRTIGSGVTTAPATPAMQGGGTLGGRHITKLTVF